MHFSQTVHFYFHPRVQLHLHLKVHVHLTKVHMHYLNNIEVLPYLLYVIDRPVRLLVHINRRLPVIDRVSAAVDEVSQLFSQRVRLLHHCHGFVSLFGRVVV